MASNTADQGTGKTTGNTEAKTPSGAGSGQAFSISNDNIMYLFAYLLTIISGIIVLLIAPANKRLKLHAMQSILLGIAIIVISIISGIVASILLIPVALGACVPPYCGTAISLLVGSVFELINFLIWLYGMYVGYKAYTGTDVTIPVITDLAKGFVK